MVGRSDIGDLMRESSTSYPLGPATAPSTLPPTSFPPTAAPKFEAEEEEDKAGQVALEAAGEEEREFWEDVENCIVRTPEETVEVAESLRL